MNKVRDTILKTIAYFDVFQYPVTRQELISYSCLENIPHYIDGQLESLQREGVIFKIDEFYSLHNNSLLAERRRRGNRQASVQLRIAARAANLLSRFPFVRSIAISGSLSKHFSEGDADIDFFIITAANRLWIARTCMHVFKKLTYLAGKQHCFCMNYYVDEQQLEIPEKNIFTAMEIVTLLPVYGMDCFRRFMEANDWALDYFPEQVSTATNLRHHSKMPFRAFLEKLFHARVADRLDTWLMGLTDRRWKKKTLQGKTNEHGDKMEMRAGRHFSKPNPDIFPAGVLRQYDKRIQQLTQAYPAPDMYPHHFFRREII